MCVCVHVWRKVFWSCVFVCACLRICVFVTETVTGMYYDHVCVCRYSVCVCVCMYGGRYSGHVCLCVHVYVYVSLLQRLLQGCIMTICVCVWGNGGGEYNGHVCLHVCTCFFVAGM